MNKLTCSTKTITEVIDGNQFTVDVSKIMAKGVVMFNATELAKAYGKLFADYKRRKEFDSYINVVSTETGIPISGLVKIVKGGNAKNAQGSWLHQDLALDFARWLNPTFGYKLDQYILGLFQHNDTIRTERLIGKEVFKAHSKEVASQGGAYSEEGNTICLAVYGVDSAKRKRTLGITKSQIIWDHATDAELVLRARLTEMNMGLMKASLGRTERLRILIASK